MFTSVESSFLLHQRFTPCQLSKDNIPIVLLLFLRFLHAKDISRNIHVFQCGMFIPTKLLIFGPLCCLHKVKTYTILA